MTADAKVGLLLGLFFIVIIAFLVNGLPNFIQEKDTSTTSVSIITPTGQDMELDNTASEAAHRLYPPRAAAGQRTTQPPQEVVVLDSLPDQTPQVEIPDLVPRRQTQVVIQNDPPAVVQEVAQAPKARTHVVKSGENLAVIAQTYYGPEEGNRRIVIQKLYEANTGVLKSPDQVRVGHKLTIPPHNDLLNPSEKVVKAPNPTKTLLNKFSNLLEQVGEDNTQSVREYVVQKGDSLWDISEQLLGNGNRYPDIVKFNKDKNISPGDLPVGLRLSIPPQ